MNTEKRKSFIINITYYALVIALVLCIVKYLVKWLLPFLIGFAIAFALKPIIRFISRIFKMKRKFGAFIVILLAYGALTAGIWFLSIKLVSQLWRLFLALPDLYQDSILPSFERLNETIIRYSDSFSPQVSQWLGNVLENFNKQINNLIDSISSGVLEALKNSAAFLPSFLLGLVFTIISSIMISMDYNRITGFLVRQVPERFQATLFDIKDYLVKTFFRYIKAYLIIMLITFGELSLGLTILQVENAIAISAIISIADMLPVLGTGTIVIPWIIIELIQGHYNFTIGLTIVFIIITLVRNIIEPRILGKQIGLYPLATFIAMYVGLKIFGFWGMVLMPTAFLLLKNLNDTGTIKLWKQP